MSLAVRSLDLDFEKGIFRADGYMKLRWTDKRSVALGSRPAHESSSSVMRNYSPSSHGTSIFLLASSVAQLLNNVSPETLLQNFVIFTFEIPPLSSNLLRQLCQVSGNNPKKGNKTLSHGHPVLLLYVVDCIRYIWDPSSYDGIDSVPLPFSQTWSPEVILHNSVEEKFIYRRVGVVRHTGEIVYVVSVHTKSACEPNFGEYPFGMQLCSLKFGSWVNGQGLQDAGEIMQSLRCECHCIGLLQQHATVPKRCL